MIDERRRELGAFLRTRREQLVRADFQLPPVGSNRITGLRREEVAYHAGISVTWYTWLEQGRNANPSRQVLDAIANATRLSVPEHHYLLALAGYAPIPPGDLEPATAAPPHIQRLLEAQGASPAFAIAPDWGFGGWNGSYEALYPNIAKVPEKERNLLSLIFTDPSVRRLLPDWETTAGHFLAEYRADAGPALGTPAHQNLVSRLLAASPSFKRAWNEHHVERFASRERKFQHPEVGELIFEHHRLTPSDLPDIHIVVYLPVDNDTRIKMQALTQPPSA